MALQDKGIVGDDELDKVKNVQDWVSSYVDEGLKYPKNNYRTKLHKK